ncbi:MAG: methylated-DNA--[protein]-cysteine S-methyltransferase [Syntrophomonadaceae bacterium]|nr:methylated-DNA--[protein]-cysteine S-methyltransferase [Syntrophomonadaceae bacterium]MDH7498139.1 methylated-DNA--[protein]-cysteine S-methyltransferase [Syntrophomonadaceae bacterium]
MRCETAIGPVTMVESGGAIVRLVLGGEGLDPGAGEEPSELLREAASQLRSYLAGRRRSFSVPLSPGGSPFMRTVWERLQQIPYGGTMSYGQLAAALGRARGARAVGRACALNPIPILIPCHRVVGAQGALGGFSAGPGVKQWLLELEARGLGGGQRGGRGG